MKIEISENENAALTLLKNCGVPILEAAQLTCTALKTGHGKIKRTLRCLQEGEKALQLQEKTVTFEKAVKAEVKSLSQRLASYKRPMNVFVIDEPMPRTATRKVKRNEVKKLVTK